MQYIKIIDIEQKNIWNKRQKKIVDNDGILRLNEKCIEEWLNQKTLQ